MKVKRRRVHEFFGLSNISGHARVFAFVQDKPFAKDLPVMFLLSYYTCEGYVFGDDYDWREEHIKTMTNQDIQYYVVVTGDPSVVYQNQFIIAKRTQMLIDSLDGVE